MPNHNFLIPMNPVASASSPGMGTPQISLNVQDDPNAAAWAGLSKSLQGLQGTVVNIGELEHKQEKVMESFKADLSIMEKNLSPEEYQKLVTEQQGKLQRDGIIHAYESFTFMDAVEKQRAKIRLELLGSKLQEQLPMLTNPTKPISYDQALEGAFSTLEQEEGVLDVAGNSISFDMGTLSTGEQLEMAKGLISLEHGASQAIQEIRNDRAIEVSTSLFRNNIFEAMEHSAFVPREVLSQHLEEIFNTGFNAGVVQPNKEFFKSLETWVEHKGDNAPLSPDTYKGVHDLLDYLAVSQNIRPGHALAPAGSENFKTLEDARDTFETIWSARQRTLSSSLSYNKEILENKLQREVLDLILIGADEKEVATTIAVRSKELGIQDPDKILGKFDSLMQNLKKEDAGNPVYAGSLLHDVTLNQFHSDALVGIEQEAANALLSGDLSYEEYKAIRTAVNTELSGLQSIGIAAVEFGGEYTNMITDLEQVFKATLKQNNYKRSLGVNKFTGVENFVMVGGHDDRMTSVMRFKMESFLSEASEVAIYGGELLAIIPALSPEDHALLQQERFNVGEIDAVLQTVNTPITFEVPPEGEALSSREFKRRKRMIERQARAYTEYLAMMQILAHRKAPESSIESQRTIK